MFNISHLPGDNKDNTLNKARAFRVKFLNVTFQSESKAWKISDRSPVGLGGRLFLCSLNSSYVDSIVAPPMLAFLIS